MKHPLSLSLSKATLQRVPSRVCFDKLSMNGFGCGRQAVG